MAPGPDLSALADEAKAPNDITISKSKLKINPSTDVESRDSVLDPASITQEFDELRFEAAASRQLDFPDPKDHSTDRSSQLISSPYNNPGHYLDLSTLDTPNLIFAKALTALKPLRSDYATAPYISSLDFPTVLSLVRSFSREANYTWKSHTFYVVIFRSQLKADIDNDLLYKLDYESHREACESGGLLKYWFGKTDGERRNMATCFWRSREDAHLGGLGPWHKKARAAGRTLYESIRFSTHRFTLTDGAEEIKFEDWEEAGR
ncbi:uncharacterized protein N0V89_004691 [Didymosphaeria variabile]|uniref:Uncharacterized protein n=1 Tax=Didymosphaeria variabile TaxID=1932322 RepID=A0A9W8XPW7_9PLEO|nr:uncharacterized protein N0V89_004691 [Didymosphaeria variabile]KAJ4356655.1 hypothetical protein N0V89_004691 [Didymosphaeria variabile]